MKVVNLFAIIFFIVFAAGCSKDQDLVTDQNEEQKKEQIKEDPESTDKEEQVNEDPTAGEENSGNNVEPAEPGEIENDDKETPAIGNTVKGKVSFYNTDGSKRSNAGAVEVKMFDASNKLVGGETFANGSFTFENIKDGNYSIRAYKSGYFNKPDVKGSASQALTCKVTNGDPVTSGECRLYKKSTATIKSISWRQGNKANGDASNGVVLDINFDQLDLTQFDKYVFIYFFVGYNDQISKFNCKETIDRKSGDGWVPGYVMARIPVSAITNKVVKGYWDSNFCGWMGGSLKLISRPSHVAIYTSTAFGYGDDGLFGDKYVAVGDDYSGISDKIYLRKY